MTNIMVAGDWHGAEHHASKMIYQATQHKANKIVQCGDFGLWDHSFGGVTYLDVLNEQARKYGVKIYALPGNHENHDHWEWYIAHYPRDKYGFTAIRSHISISPKVHYWTWGEKTLAIAGGAVSIDKEYRLNVERMSNAPRTLWWDQEQLTDADLPKLVRKAEYLFSHDGPPNFPLGLKPDLESNIHRQRMGVVLDAVRPEKVFHGHYHMYIEYDYHNIPIIALDRDGTQRNAAILNLETGNHYMIGAQNGTNL